MIFFVGAGAGVGVLLGATVGAAVGAGTGCGGAEDGNGLRCLTPDEDAAMTRSGACEPDLCAPGAGEPDLEGG